MTTLHGVSYMETDRRLVPMRYTDMALTRRRLCTLAVLCINLCILATLYASPALAAKPQPAECHFEGEYLYASGLPIDIPLSLTHEFYPTGTTWETSTGSVVVYTIASDAYFWVRGHGPSLRKAGPQLNDYHLVAECHRV